MEIQEHESLVDGLVPISFTDGDFANIKFTIGKVRLVEQDSNLVIKFDLNVIDDISFKLYEKFKSKVGDYIVHQIESNDIIFSNGTGGTFEN